jgi:hypothetical protein
MTILNLVSDLTEEFSFLYYINQEKVQELDKAVYIIKSIYVNHRESIIQCTGTVWYSEV